MSQAKKDLLKIPLFRNISILKDVRIINKEALRGQSIERKH